VGDRRTLADSRAGRVRPDLGGPQAHPSAGAACLGARNPLVAYNVLLEGATAASATALARSMRPGQGGPPGLQALAFDFSGGVWQLSMNLVELESTPPAAALAEVRRRAAGLGIGVGPDEVVGLCPAAYALPSAAGRVLEARLAAAGMVAATIYDISGSPGVRLVHPLYRQALDRGLIGERRRRAVIQLASSLRNIGRPDESVALVRRRPANSWMQCADYFAGRRKPVS